MAVIGSYPPLGERRKEVTADVTVELKKPLISPVMYEIWGKELSIHEMIRFEASFDRMGRKTVRRIPFLTTPLPGRLEVRKIDFTDWWVNQKFAPSERASRIEIKSPIYVTLGEPVGCMERKLRHDALEIACDMAEGISKKEFDQYKSLDEELYHWLERNNYVYDNTVFHYNVKREIFDLTEFKKEQKGDCEDASCLLKVCLDALGVEVERRPAYLKRVIPEWPFSDKFITNYVSGFGEKNEQGERRYEWKEIATMHQITIIPDDSASYYVCDPTFLYYEVPRFISGYFHEDSLYYLRHLVSSGMVVWSIEIFDIKEVK